MAGAVCDVVIGRVFKIATTIGFCLLVLLLSLLRFCGIAGSNS